MTLAIRAPMVLTSAHDSQVASTNIKVFVATSHASGVMQICLIPAPSKCASLMRVFGGSGAVIFWCCEPLSECCVANRKALCLAHIVSRVWL
jgi:hypothetical protein